jgi:hypothetical protein
MCVFKLASYQPAMIANKSGESVLDSVDLNLVLLDEL